MADAAQRISEELRISRKQVESVLSLLKSGYSIPFIAHYRRQATSGLDENRLRAIRDQIEYWDEFEQRRATAIKAIADAGKLTPEIEAGIKALSSRPELEDSFMAYRARRRTRSGAARQKGLDGLAELIWKTSSSMPDLLSFNVSASDASAKSEGEAAEKPGETPAETPAAEAAPASQANSAVEELVKPFIKADKGVNNMGEALAGARDMLAERVSEDATVRKIARDILLADGRVSVKPREGADMARGKYSSLMGFSEPLTKVPLQRYLLALRGSGEKQLSVVIEAPREKIVAELKAKLTASGDAPLKAELALVIEECFDRLLGPGLDNEIRQDLKRRADLDAVAVCMRNLRALLMQAPLGAQPVAGIEVVAAGGIRVAAIDAAGKVLGHEAIPAPKTDDEKKAAIEKLTAFVKQHGANAIAIAHGATTRDLELNLREALRAPELKDTFIIPLHGQTSVQPGREDLQDVEPAARFPVALARRVQNPLAELLKADPQTLNIGVHQHDIDEALLKRRLEEVVAGCVCDVTLDLNTATASLLRHVPGIGATLAQKVVDARTAKTTFASREDLKTVEGLGAVEFENAAGFLRIETGAQALDATRVHPESYALVEKLAQAASVAVNELPGNTAALEKIDAKAFATENFNERSVRDLIALLKEPKLDPRGPFVKPEFSADVKSLADLKDGLILNGVVTNLTPFGAFVDIGLPQDGLVHVSAITHRFIRDASEALSVGQTVKVKVLSVDSARKRISLSMKELEPAPAPRQPRRAQGSASGPRPARPPRGPRPAGAVAGAPGAAATGEGQAPGTPGQGPRRDFKPRGPRQPGQGGPGGPGSSGKGGPNRGGPRDSRDARETRAPAKPEPGKPDYSKFFVKAKRKERDKSKDTRQSDGATRDEVRQMMKQQSGGGTTLGDLLRKAGVSDEEK
jgi:protein Tex